MVLIYILSILSLSSLFIEKTQPIQINQVEENQIINVKTIKPQNTEKFNQTNTWSIENDLSGANNENSDLQNIEDDYEEIVFQDNFDKEYRSGTENNYLGD